MTFETGSLARGVSRSPSWARPFALALALLAGTLACRTTAEPQAPPPKSDAPQTAGAGYVLVYRKPSGEPFTSAEVEQIGTVLRKRLQTIESSLNLSATGEAGNQLHVALRNVPNEGVVDALRPSFEVVGELSFEGVANDSIPGWDTNTELELLDAWWEAQAAPALERYNELPRSADGPPEFVRWREPRTMEPDLSTPERLMRFVPCVKADVLYAGRGWAFGTRDLDRVFPTQDETGFPALGFEMRQERREAFGDFTEAYVGEQIAIVIDGKVVSAPIVNERLLGASIVQGRFEGSEVSAWMLAFQTGALPTPLEFVEVRASAAR